YYDFTLRRDVTFQDGEPLTSKSVKWNFDRILDTDLKVPLRSTFTNITKVEPLDETTVRFHLKHPDADLPTRLADSAAALLSPSSVDDDGNSRDNITNPIGTGQYTFKTFKKGDSATFERNDEYWGDKANFSELVFHIITEDNSREA